MDKDEIGRVVDAWADHAFQETFLPERLHPRARTWLVDRLAAAMAEHLAPPPVDWGVDWAAGEPDASTLSEPMEPGASDDQPDISAPPRRRRQKEA